MSLLERIKNCNYFQTYNQLFYKIFSFNECCGKEIYIPIDTRKIVEIKNISIIFDELIIITIHFSKSYNYKIFLTSNLILNDKYV